MKVENEIIRKVLIMEGIPWSNCKSGNSMAVPMIEIQTHCFLLLIFHKLFRIKTIESMAKISFNQLNGPTIIMAYNLFENISLRRLIITERSTSVGIHLKYVMFPRLFIKYIKLNNRKPNEISMITLPLEVAKTDQLFFNKYLLVSKITDIPKMLKII